MNAVKQAESVDEILKARFSLSSVRYDNELAEHAVYDRETGEIKTFPASFGGGQAAMLWMLGQIVQAKKIVGLCQRFAHSGVNVET